MSAYRPSRRCKLSDADTLTIYLDEKRTKPLRRFTGTSLSQFHPVVIASNRFWLQFQVTTPPLLSLSLSMLEPWRLLTSLCSAPERDAQQRTPVGLSDERDSDQRAPQLGALD